MAMVATDIKSMLSISIKSRHDSYTDQYNRIFMVKMLLVSSLIMGISWFQDSIHCMVPGIFQRLHTYMFCLVVSFVCLFFFCCCLLLGKKAWSLVYSQYHFRQFLPWQTVDTQSRIWLCTELTFYFCSINLFSSNKQWLSKLNRFIEGR